MEMCSIDISVHSVYSRVDDEKSMTLGIKGYGSRKKETIQSDWHNTFITLIIITYLFTITRLTPRLKCMGVSQRSYYD